MARSAPSAGKRSCTANGPLLLAIGYDFTAASSPGAGVAAGVLEAAGTVAIAWSLATARSRKMLDAPVILIGLALLAVSFLADGIVAGLSFSTLTALGTGLTVVTPVELAGVVALGLAAWTRVRELYRWAVPQNGGRDDRHPLRDSL